MGRVTMLLSVLRLASGMASGQMRAVRRRAVRGAVTIVVAALCVLLALGLGVAALAVWLETFLPLWAALLAIAGGLTVIALALFLTLRGHKPTVPQSHDIAEMLRAVGAAPEKLDGKTMVLVALAAGFLVGQSRGRPR